MKTFLATSLAFALTVSASTRAFGQTDQIVGGFTPFTFNSSFLGLLSGAGITVTDLAGNSLPNGTNVLPALQGVIDLQTGATNVTFKGGYQVTTQGATVRVEDMILHASEAASAVTGVIVENGHVLGRKEIFLVNQNPNLVLPLQVTDEILKLPTLSLGVAPDFTAELNKFLGKPVLNPGIQVATATPTAVVVPDIAVKP